MSTLCRWCGSYHLKVSDPSPIVCIRSGEIWAMWNLVLFDWLAKSGTWLVVSLLLSPLSPSSWRSITEEGQGSWPWQPPMPQTRNWWCSEDGELKNYRPPDVWACEIDLWNVEWIAINHVRKFVVMLVCACACWLGHVFCMTFGRQQSSRNVKSNQHTRFEIPAKFSLLSYMHTSMTCKNLRLQKLNKGCQCRTNVGERMFMSLWTSNLKSVHFVVSPRIGRSGVLPNLPVGQKNMWTTVRLHDSNLFFRYGRHNEESITSVKEVIRCTILSVISEPNATVQRSGTP